MYEKELNQKVSALVVLSKFSVEELRFEFYLVEQMLRDEQLNDFSNFRSVY